MFTIGQKVELRVINVNRQERKLGLSTRLEGQATAQQQSYHHQGNNNQQASQQQGHAQQKAKAPRRQGQGPKEQRGSFKDNASHSDNSSPLKSSLQMALEGAMKKNDDANDETE